jgi:protein involved in polysaccharide export with SLBB domain
MWSCAAVWLISFAALGEEPEPVIPPGAFRFMGGEKIKVVAPESIGGSLEQIVSDDGYITLPSGGEPLNIKNKSILEAWRLAAARIEKDLGAKKATVGISLLGLPQRNVFVGGEGVKVNQNVPLTGTAPVSLYAAIIAAGGVTPEGDATHVSLSRTLPDGSVKNEIVDISHFGDPGNKSLGPLLEPGDVVKVPRGDVFILAGEVTKAGPVTRRELGTPAGQPVYVSNLVYTAGGLKQGANRKNVKVLRTLKDGTRLVITVDLDAPKTTSGKGDPKSKIDGPPGGTRRQGGGGEKGGEGAGGGEPTLEDGDVVLVNPGGAIPVLGRVRLPGLYPMGSDTIKLSRAIALAGGFADFAKQSSVIVLKASNGFSPMHIDMSLIQKGGFQDVELEENDLVYVSERML